MSNVPTDQGHGGHYEIRVSGHLATRWGAWFDGMTLTQHDDGTTVMQGQVADQSALHGLLHKLSDLGMPLISINRTTDRRSTS